MEGKIAVLGLSDFVMPFAALGIHTFPTGPARDEIAENAQKIIDARYALVVVAENIAPVVEQSFADYHNIPTPCVLVVPFTTEPTGFATKNLGEALKMATGINILQNR